MKSLTYTCSRAVLVLAVAVVVWTMAPLATGAPSQSASSDARISLDVPTQGAVTPGWQTGTSDVRIPDLGVPGSVHDATSAGWRMSTNWPSGYEVRIRATTDPALRGQNAIDGAGADGAFADFTTSGCPCAWSTDGATSGVFGYSASVSESRGPAPLDTDRWGTMRAPKFRGLSRSSYRIYASPGGSGDYVMSLRLRAAIPSTATQAAGSYRASLIVSAHPLL